MSDESKIIKLIQQFLLDEGLLKERVFDPKIEFGFQFIFPLTPLGKIMFVIKPKNKDLIVITIGTQISDSHINTLNSLEPNKKLQFFIDLRKFFFLKDVFFRLDIKNSRYEISEQVFLKEDKTISKNTFFKNIRKVFNSEAYSNIILEEYCSGKIKPEDIFRSENYSTGTEFSLYS